jgi:hypothetical protein
MLSVVRGARSLASVLLVGLFFAVCSPVLRRTLVDRLAEVRAAAAPSA